MWNVSLALLGHLADASVRVLGLALVAVVVLAIPLMRRARRAPRVWSAVMAGMLALPVLAPLLPPLAVKMPLASRFGEHADPSKSAKFLALDFSCRALEAAAYAGNSALAAGARGYLPGRRHRITDARAMGLAHMPPPGRTLRTRQ